MKDLKFDLQLFSVVNGTDGNDYIENKYGDVSIYAGNGNDSIYSSRYEYGGYWDLYSNLLDGGNGNDRIVLSNNTQTTVYGGDGHDYIDNSAIGSFTWSSFMYIYGGAGNDSIDNYNTKHSTIIGGTGNDYITFSGYYQDGNVVVYEYGDGDDTIEGMVSGNTLKITGANYYTVASGLDTVVNIYDGGSIVIKNSRLSIDGTYKEYNPLDIQGTSGADSIANTLDGATIDALAGNDTIVNYGSNVSINGGAGNDVIHNAVSNVTINAGDGADSILNEYANYVTINGGDGADTIYNASEYVSIDGGAGNDSIYYSGTSYSSGHMTVNGGAGNDTITGRYGSSSINGGAGDDVINISAGDVDDATIRGGTGDDIIYMDNNDGLNYIQYSSGDGNDTIYYFQSGDTVSLSGLTYVLSTVGSDVIISITSGGSMTLKNASGKTVNIVGGTQSIPAIFTSGNDNYSNTVGSTVLNALAGNDSIYNSAYYVTINGDAGNDSIYNAVSYVTINGGDGADTILSSYASNYASLNGGYVSLNGGAGSDYISVNSGATVDGGAGNDTIVAYGSYVSLNGGDGNDKISLGNYYYYNSGRTVKGGKGNDTIYGDSLGYYGVVYQYDSGDGNDVIYNYKANDTLNLGGASYSSTTSGNNVILTVGSGKITLVGAKGKTINIPKNYIYISNSNILVNGNSGNDVIYYRSSARYSTVKAGAGDDSIASSYTYIPYYTRISAEGGNDTITGYYYYSTLDGGAGNDVISILGGGTSNSIDGGAGNDTIYSSYGGLINGGTGNDNIYSNSTATINGGDGKDTIYTYYGSVNGGAGNDYISVASDATVDGGADNDTIVASGSYVSLNGGDGNDKISLGNYYYYNSGRTVKGGKGNDTIYGDSLGYYGVIYQYSSGDGNDVIYNWKASDTINLGGSVYTSANSGSNVVLTVGSGKVTLVGAKGKTINVASGTLKGSGVYISNSNSNTIINGTSNADTIYNYSGDYSTIKMGSGNDSIYSSDADYSTIYAEAGKDTIDGYYWSSKLYGGAGNDLISISGSTSNTIDGGADNDTILSYYGGSLNGGAGNDLISMGSSYYYSLATIKGGTGNDTIYGSSLGSYGVIYQYAKGDGNDIIYGFKSNDTLSISGSSYTTTTSGNNVIYTVGSNKITLVGAKSILAPKGNYISNTNNNTVISGTEKNDTLYSYYGGDYSRVSMGAGDDSIYFRDADYSTIYAEGGNDTINGYYWNSKIYGGTGNDYISINGGGTSNSIDGGAGNDTIYSYYGGSINGGTGNDSIYSSRTATINGGDGNDTITSNGGSIIGGKGADKITSSAAATINGGDDNDTINSKGGSIIGGAGNDRISVSAAATIDGGSGDDMIYGYSKSSINGGSGADLISVSASTKADGGDGNDSIYASGASNSLYGGAGNDLISLKADANGNTIKGGTGNDTIYGRNSGGGILYQYANGDGNDIIYNWKAADTINLGGASYTSANSGSNVILTIGSGKVTLVGANGKKINVKDGKVASTSQSKSGKEITNNAQDTLLQGTDYNDTVINKYVDGKNTGDRVTINTGAGADSVYIYFANDTRVDAGAGNDSITMNKGENISISGGEGNDQISLNAVSGNVTINGGTGNDTVYSENISAGVLYQYSKGDGNDVIYGYESKDIITISGGNWSVDYSDRANVVVNVAGSGKITLVGAQGKTININPNDSEISQQQVIQKFMDALDTLTGSGVIRLNNAIKIASGGYFRDINAVIKQMVTDCKTANSAETFLEEYCGIDLDNDDTGAITGSDAGSTRIDKDKDSIVQEDGSLDKNFSSQSFKVNNLTVKLAKAPSSLSKEEKFIWQGLKTWWIKSALDLINESYGSKFGFNSGSSKNETITVEFNQYKNGDDGNSDMQAYVTRLSNNQLLLDINTAFYGSIDTKDPNGAVSLSNGEVSYLDRTIAHEFTHAAMMTNTKDYKELPLYIQEGMAELTHGVDDERKDDLLALAGNSKLLESALPKMNLGINLGNRLEPIDGVKAPDYSAGYMFLRYLAKQSSEHGNYSNSAPVQTNYRYASSSSNSQRGLTTSGTSLVAANTFDEDLIDLTEYSSTITKINATGLTNDIMIIGSEVANTIKSGSGNDFISGNVGNDLIYGGKGNDVIYGDDGNDILTGEAGNDTLYGGNGNDSLKGGDGKDVFVYGGGKDTIDDYVQGDDRIQLFGDSITSVSVKSSDVIFKTASGGSITVKKGKGKKINITDNNGNDTIYGQTLPAGISIKSSVLTASNKFTGNSINLSEYSATKADASKVTKAVTIKGTASANSIAGGTKNDTLIGGGGKDTLTGGKGKDVFVYESGNIYITDYTANDDKIKISPSISSYDLNGNDVILKTAKGDITIKGGKGKQINFLDKNNKASSKTYSTPVGISVSGKVLTAAKTFTGSSIKFADYSGVTKVDASAVTKALTITGSDLANTIIGGKGNDILYGKKGNDSLKGGDGKDVFVYEGGNDVIADYKPGQDKIKLGVAMSTYSFSGNNVIFKTSKGNVTVQGGKGKNITIVDKNDKETTNTYYENGLTANGSNLTAASNCAKTSITISSYSGMTNFNGSAVTKALTITGNSKNNSIVGGKGNDILNGGAGTNTLTGGDGKDVFVYEGGNDVITDYTAGKDKIKLGVAMSTYSFSGNDVIFKTSKGNVTVQGGVDKKITIIDNKGKETTKTYKPTLPSGISVSGQKVSISSSFSGNSVNLSDYAADGSFAYLIRKNNTQPKVYHADASQVTKALTITGNELANSILGGKGDDILYGGSGDDTLKGGSGKDVFVYESGNDVIYDYATGDKIKISSGTISETSYSDKDIVFKIGSGTLTVQNGKGKTITVIDSKNKTTTYKKTTDLFEDDNFITDALDLDSITEQKFDVQNIETQSYNTLAQESTLLTYGQDK